MDELEYEVSQAARAGPAASLRSQPQMAVYSPAQGLAPAASRLPGCWALWSFPVCGWLLRLTHQVWLSWGGLG